MRTHYVGRILRRVKSTAQKMHQELQLIPIRERRKMHILDAEDTLDLIVKNRMSIARFGDGEFNIMLHTKGVNFQSGSAALSERLRQVYRSDRPDLLVCIPYALNSLKGLNDHARDFYFSWTMSHYTELAELALTGKKTHVFGDTNISRPYKDWKKTDHAQVVFKKIRMLWDGQDILIVEGEKTRLGVGNDLFDNAKSIKRILCPAVNAFDAYEDILKAVRDLHQGELVLLALGPAATVLAYDLSVCGIRALDLGHVDIEYEWYRQRAATKVVVPGKYTNEAPNGDQVAVCEDPGYLSQIIAKIGV